MSNTEGGTSPTKDLREADPQERKSDDYKTQGAVRRVPNPGK